MNGGGFFCIRKRDRRYFDWNLGENVCFLREAVEGVDPIVLLKVEVTAAFTIATVKTTHSTRYQRLTDTFNTRREIKVMASDRTSSKTIICCENVHKSYKHLFGSNNPVLQGVNLSVPYGTM